jgi:hypothetical protein
MADTKISALTTVTSLADNDLFAFVDDPAGTPLSRSTRADSIRAYTKTYYATTTAESAASCTISDATYEPGNVLRYGAVRDSATDDFSAFSDAINQAKETTGEPVWVPPGDYHLAQPLTVTGRDVTIRGTFGSTIQWNGNVANPCITFGDGGTTTTFGIQFKGISIQDETAGSTLVKVDTCHRSTFEDIYLFAGAKLSNSGSIGLLLDECWINDFFKLRCNNLNVGVKSSGGSGGANGIQFYGPQIENFNEAGFQFPATTGFANLQAIFGGTIENGAAASNGIEIFGAGVELHVWGTYFEAGDRHVNINSTGSTDHNVSFNGCRFKSGSVSTGNDAHIRHGGAGVTLTCRECLFVDRAGVDIQSATARYVGINNTSPSVNEMAAGVQDGTANGEFVFYNTIGGSGRMDYTGAHYEWQGRMVSTPETFTAADATPSVATGNVFYTDSGTLTITHFDDPRAGQQITVISKGDVTYDTTGTLLLGSSVDLVTAVGDVTTWVYDGGATKWVLTGFVDVSADNTGGA